MESGSTPPEPEQIPPGLSGGVPLAPRPDAGEPPAGVERRGGERRGIERRAEDRGRSRLSIAQAVLWAACGSVVVLFLFFVAIGGVNPNNARAATVVVLILAIAYVVHGWRRLVGGGHVSRPDRERRGF